MAEVEVGDYGVIIRSGREAQRLTQPQFAELLDVTVGTVSRWETRQLIPTLSRVIALIENGIPARPLLYALGVPIVLPPELDLPRWLLLAWLEMTPEHQQSVAKVFQSILHYQQQEPFPPPGS